ncbi:hypothetical protein GGI05_004664, partial [Coemansia sp. RSA 2603]
MDAFDSYINQSLVDNDGSVDIDDKPSTDFTNELYYQLLLSAVNNASPTTAVVPSDPSAAAIPAAATIDPHNLTATSPESVDGVSYMDTADSNALLTAALLSALGPLTSDINAASMQGDDAMLVDSSESNAASFDHPSAGSDVAPKTTAAARVAPPASTKHAATAQPAASTSKHTTPQRPVPAAAAAARKRMPNPPPSAAARRATTPSALSNTKPSAMSAPSASRSLATPAPSVKAQSPDDALDDFDMEGVDIT